MKIEKISDNQIRCTLTRADLADRQLQLSELAYGTEKAKSLFRDMMQQAAFEFGFEAEDIPLMIEAIPLNSECIVLIITKVEDPEELDTRFSKFAPSVHDEDENQDSSLDSLNALTKGADDVLDLFKKLHDSKISEQAASTNPEPNTKKETIENAAAKHISSVTKINLSKIYSVDSIHIVTRLAHVLNGTYEGINSLYKDTFTNSYKLVVSKSSHSPEEFNKFCNIISEYGKAEKYSGAGEAYLSEHFQLIVKDNALQAFAQL